MARRSADDLIVDTVRRSGWFPFQRSETGRSLLQPGQSPPARAFTGHDCYVEAVDCRDVDTAAWIDLTTRAPANLFLHPAFLTTAIHHHPASDRPILVLAWEDGGRGRLIGLCPFQLPASPAARIASVWSYPDAPLGEPLLDRDAAGEAMTAMLDFVGTTWPRLVAVSMTGISHDSAVRRLGADYSVEAAPDSIRDIVSFETAHHRPGGSAPQAERFDGCWFTVSDTHDDVRVDLENFLALDAHQSGVDRPALIDDPAFATFTRSVTRQLSRTGQCSIHRLMRGSEAIAAAILLHEQDRTWLWKCTASRETRDAGLVQRFIARLVEIEAGRNRDTILCAPLPHEGTSGLLPKRLTCADLVVKLPGRSASNVSHALRKERRRRFARAIGRHLVAIASSASKS